MAFEVNINEAIAGVRAGNFGWTNWYKQAGRFASGELSGPSSGYLTQSYNQIKGVFDAEEAAQAQQISTAEVATVQAQADTARYQQEAAAAAEARAALQRASAAKQLFRGNMAQLSANSQSENAPSVVGGATAQAQGNPDAQGANTGRPRQRRTAIASQLGIGV